MSILCTYKRMLFRLGPANEGMLGSNDYVHSTYLSASCSLDIGALATTVESTCNIRTLCKDGERDGEKKIISGSETKTSVP